MNTEKPSARDLPSGIGDEPEKRRYHHIRLNQLENIISVMENIGGADQASNLRTRLRNHRTRARKAYQNLGEPASERAAG
jgi:hypothetical protein